MSETLALNCFILEESEDDIFTVYVETSRNVSSLKDTIKKNRKYKSKDVDAVKIAFCRASEQFDEVKDLKDLPGRTLKPLEILGEVFGGDSLDPGLIHVIIEPIPATVLGPQATQPSKRRLERENSGRFGQYCKQFKPNATVYPELRSLVYYADQTETNAPLIKKILDGGFVRLYGPRASGKSSRVIDAMTELKSKGFECLYVDLQDLGVSGELRFWSELNLKFECFDLPFAFNSPTSFIASFRSKERWCRPVVIFFDEFDVLHKKTAKDACSSMLAAIRSIRNDPLRGTSSATNSIHSIVSIGTFAITLLEQEDVNQSPFNVSEDFSSMNLTKTRVQELLQEFADDRGITINNTVIDHIFQLTNGHAGLVNVCSAAIQNDFFPLEDRIVDFACWQNFVPSILVNVVGYATFRKMVKELKEQKDAVDCLRTHFLGNFDKFVTVHPNRLGLAEFLAALGVLSPGEKGAGFKMVSPIVDSLIRQRVIPAIYTAAPSTPIPVQNNAGLLNIQEILKEALKFFDKEEIKRAHSISYKTATVKVGGYRGARVPRESIYDSELTRILRTWLRQEHHEITGQWHHFDGNNHRYSDIVIETNSSIRIVLELLATGESNSIIDHIDKTIGYKDNLSAKEAWVIHFTCEDNYLEHPCWQSDELLDKDIYMAHIWHNLDFTEVRVSARWKSWDGENRSISNERII